MDTLSSEEMFELADAFFGACAYVEGFTSNGDNYNIYPSTLSIYKNGEEVFDDYLNSDTHEYAVENTNKEVIVTDDIELGMCWSLAQDVVKSQLKSPSSAKFPFSYASKDISITKSGNIYTVKAWVEADNSFGATLRSDFTVVMEKSGSGTDLKFTSESCTIE